MFFCAISGFQPSVYSSPTILMSPLLDRVGQHLLLALAQEVGVRVGGRALDEDVVALGLDLEHAARLHAADLLVVEGDVEHAGLLDQAVVGDDRQALALLGLGQRGQDRVLVHGQDDQHLGALGDQAVDVGDLLLRRAAGVGADVLGAELASSALIAASSVFQRSSWKFDQLTPTTAWAEASVLNVAMSAAVMIVRADCMGLVSGSVLVEVVDACRLRAVAGGLVSD